MIKVASFIARCADEISFTDPAPAERIASLILRLMSDLTDAINLHRRFLPANERRTTTDRMLLLKDA